MFRRRGGRGGKRGAADDPPGHRSFVPPAQRGEPRIATTGQLQRTWSTRTTRLCLNRPPPPPGTATAARSLTSEVADRHPGSFFSVYRQNLTALFTEEIACDVSFRVVSGKAATESIVHAHRCIVAARLPSLIPILSSAPEAGEIVVPDGMSFSNDPELLRATIGSCYGMLPDPSTSTAASGQGQVKVGQQPSWIVDPSTMLQDLAKLQHPSDHDDDIPQDEARLAHMAPPDVRIVGSPPNATSSDSVNWEVQAHAAILCAQSEYFRSALTHGWETTKPSQERKRELRLDSKHFAEDTIQELVSACYGAPLDMCNEPLESILQLIDGAAYLGMKAVSLLCEEALAQRYLEPGNVPDLIQFSQDTGAELLLLECHKFLCRNLNEVRQAGCLEQLSHDHMEALLRSNFVNTPEDDILDTVLMWTEVTGASFDKTKELVNLVRLPFVPVASPSMKRAIEKNLVGEDMVRVCRLFQTDGDYRQTMMNCEPMYRPRQGESNQAELRAHLRRLEPPPPPDRPDSPPREMFVCRMLGVVNGRTNFERICSVKLSESGDKLVLDASLQSSTPTTPNQASPPFIIPINFKEIHTPHMPSAEDKAEHFIDALSLQKLPVDYAEHLVAAMLWRENEMRLHSKVQAAFAIIGEDEEEMSRFTIALQAHVSSEFNVDPAVGIELIHSASTLFPETAKLAHYVRHNRCFQGSLRVGDQAPDISIYILNVR